MRGPRRELHQDDFQHGEIDTVTLLPAVSAKTESEPKQDIQQPPVQKGDVRAVEIENSGRQDDGTARIDRGYVVIVPNTDVRDRVIIEITTARQTMAHDRNR